MCFLFSDKYQEISDFSYSMNQSQEDPAHGWIKMNKKKEEEGRRNLLIKFKWEID